MTDPVRHTLADLAACRITLDDAASRLAPADGATPPVADLDFATIDHERGERCGVPEVVYAAGKTPEQVVVITGALVERHGHALVTRADRHHAEALAGAFEPVHVGERSQTLLVGPRPDAVGTSIPIVTAGTSDEPVAGEAQLTCAALGQRCHRVNDVGVAGVHRLLRRKAELDRAGVIICIAGMEGALPSVLGGIVRVPVIAVPTSVGYGAAMGGLAALMGMLTSCAAGVTVVNIDNGFGAAYIATLIQHQTDAPPPPERT
ncbi:MAG: nickel pincer cofactor biosynthesis protein LarB [Alphaproteobacteria bacterium]|jgi:NCAIR mutase (PurE)-related protein|nr:nickel pincer cofactor biosynthesis protein LarB [Alphaproteobacteria bacterium]